MHCYSVTLNPRLKWLDPSIRQRACSVCTGLQSQAVKRWKTRPNHQMHRFDCEVCGSIWSRSSLPEKVTSLLWSKAGDKWNQAQSPAETCSPEMIENGLVAVTAMYQLIKQKQKNSSACLADNSLWIFSCYKHGWNDSLHRAGATPEKMLLWTDDGWFYQPTNSQDLSMVRMSWSYCTKLDTSFSPICRFIFRLTKLQNWIIWKHKTEGATSLQFH